MSGGSQGRGMPQEWSLQLHPRTLCLEELKEGPRGQGGHWGEIKWGLVALLGTCAFCQKLCGALEWFSQGRDMIRCSCFKSLLRKLGKERALWSHQAIYKGVGNQPSRTKPRG